MTFLGASVDWFLGKRSSHMGLEQYAAHNGVRDGHSTSGALLWAESELKTVLATGNMVNAETNLLHQVGVEIGDYVPSGTAIVELGPGTATAFRNKTLPIAHKLKSEDCVLIDGSIAFLKQIVATSVYKEHLKIKPVVDDFFEVENPYFDEQALVCSFGSTISNIVGPISKNLPQAVLVDGLSKMARAANEGWMLIAFDSDNNEERIKSFYSDQSSFQLNIFDRMAAELPIKGDFDPKAFDYEPQWIASSGQLAHIAATNRPMNFELGGVEISLQKDRRLHIKNSYKFEPAFFEKCCALAGLDVIKSWSDSSPSNIYLLKIFRIRQLSRHKLRRN